MTAPGVLSRDGPPRDVHQVHTDQIGPVLLLAGLLLGQLIRVSVLSTAVKSAPVLAIDLAVGLLWLLVFLQAARTPTTLRLDTMNLLVLLFAAWAISGVALTAARATFSLRQVAFSSLYLVRWLFYFGVYLWVTHVLHPDSMSGLVRKLTLAIVAFATFGIVQSVFLPNFAFMVYPDAVPYQTWDIQNHRLVSTLLDPNYAGSLIAIGILLVLPTATRQRGSMRIPFLILITALFLTASRGAIGSAIAGSAVVAVALGVRTSSRHVPRALGLVFGAVAVVAIVFWAAGGPGLVQTGAAFLKANNKLTVTDASALTRLWAWQKDVQILMAHPIIGIGFNTLGFVQGQFGMHRTDNSAFGLDGGLLFVAALTGIAGTLLYASLSVVAIARGVRLSRTARAPQWVRDVGAATAGATAVWLLEGFFINTLFYPFLLVTVWLLWGVVTVLWRRRGDWGLT